MVQQSNEHDTTTADNLHAEVIANTSHGTTPIATEVYPPQADLRKHIYQPLPVIAPGTVDSGTVDASTEAAAVMDAFNRALQSNDTRTLAGCFFSQQSFWKDMIALTAHYRTFSSNNAIAAAFVETKALRALKGKISVQGKPMLIVVNPVLLFITCSISFRTESPGAACGGQMLLLPTKTGGSLDWKIWSMTTWIEDLDIQHEDESLLQASRKGLDNLETIEIPVFIIGGGNSGITMAARLKALGVDSVIADRNPRVGDNWALRYDCMKFHLPSSSCELPYLRYKKELQHPHLLDKYDLAEHLRNYAATFGLNIITSASIKSTYYRPQEQKWTVQLQTPKGRKTVMCKHLIQATGIGAVRPYLPPMKDDHLFTGLSLHSGHYRNAKLLAEQGIKSALVIGSANTAFDVVQDCHDAGLQTTMVARSPTYLLPFDYILDPHALGASEIMPLEIADKMLYGNPEAVTGQLSHGLFAHLASEEPERYDALKRSGFPVLDSRHPDANLEHHLVERAGGHYVDVGGTALLAEGKVKVRGLVEPVAYTATGLQLSDGSVVEADAVIWCTGFADRNVRATAADILGGVQEGSPAVEEGGDVLGPAEIASRLDATWGVDAEGEVRGVWKRHLRMENYWVMGGNLQHQRWNSRPLAQQIKMALEGILPPAYRDTPEPYGVVTTKVVE